MYEYANYQLRFNLVLEEFRKIYTKKPKQRSTRYIQAICGLLSTKEQFEGKVIDDFNKRN